MLLQDLTWPEVEAYLQHRDSIIIPTGSTAQHGPTGVMGTDAMVAEAIAHGIGETADVLVGPTLSIGIAEHHMGFAGTLTLRPSTLMVMIQDYVFSLVRHGFKRFYFVNGHGGNIATLKASFAEIYTLQQASKNTQTLQCSLANWYNYSAVVKLRRHYYGDKEGRHATPSEIAVVQYLRNDLICSKPESTPAPVQGDVYGADDFRQKYPDGRMGSFPSLATPQQGQLLFDAAVKEGAKQLESFITP